MQYICIASITIHLQKNNSLNGHSIEPWTVKFVNLNLVGCSHLHSLNLTDNIFKKQSTPNMKKLKAPACQFHRKPVISNVTSYIAPLKKITVSGKWAWLQLLKLIFLSINFIYSINVTLRVEYLSCLTIWRIQLHQKTRIMCHS